MEHGQNGRTAVGGPPTAQGAHGPFRPQEMLGGNAAERHDHARPDQIDLALQESRAGRHLVLLGVTISGWSALHDIRDVELRTFESEREDHFVQQATGLTDEWPTTSILLGSWTLTDEEHGRIRTPLAKHDRFPRFAKPAPFTSADEIGQFNEVPDLFGRIGRAWRFWKFECFTPPEIATVAGEIASPHKRLHFISGAGRGSLLIALFTTVGIGLLGFFGVRFFIFFDAGRGSGSSVHHSE